MKGSYIDIYEVRYKILLLSIIFHRNSSIKSKDSKMNENCTLIPAEL